VCVCVCFIAITTSDVTALQIANTISCLAWENLVGLFSCDCLPDTESLKSEIYPAIYILRCKRKLDVSKHPKHHWVLVFLTDAKNGIFFSSCGSPPSEFSGVKDFLSRVAADDAEIKYNSKRIQGIRNNSCGTFVVAITYLLCLGLPPEVIYDMFSFTNYSHNTMMANVLFNYCNRKFNPTKNYDMLMYLHKLCNIDKCAKNAGSQFCSGCTASLSYPINKIKL
jgi:hypothetical protein